MVKKLNVEISADAELVKRLNDVHSKLVAMGAKVILFNHENLVHCKRGLVSYNLQSREMIFMTLKDELNYAIASDTTANNKRLEALEEIVKSGKLIGNENVYGYFDNLNNFHCTDSKFDRHYDFDAANDDKPDYAAMTTIYFNPGTDSNNHPKYIIQEHHKQYGTCDECHKLILDELDGALVRGSMYCYDCIVKNEYEGYVDTNKLKLMQLNKMDQDM